jgi:hypothetical protein
VSLTLLAYSCWVLLNVVVAAVGIGDGGVSSHLVLVFTGFPLALFSLAFEHASVLAVSVAGGLGLVQWVVVVFLYGRRNASPVA